MKKVLCTITLLMMTLSFAISQTEETSSDWTAFVKKVDVASTSKELKFRVTALAKVNFDGATSFSGIWARVNNKDGEMGFFDNMGDRPISATEWEFYEIEGVINAKSDRLFFGGLCMGNGQFFFDEFQLEIQDDNGVFQVVELENMDFNKSVVNNQIPAWGEGISDRLPQRIKEFKFSSYKDEGSVGSALLVEGKIG